MGYVSLPEGNPFFFSFGWFFRLRIFGGIQKKSLQIFSMDNLEVYIHWKSKLK